MERLIKSVVVTGASSGIGFSVSEVLTKRGYRVFGSVRTRGDALRLKNLFGERFEPLPMDVASKASVKMAAEMVRRRLNATNLHGLVNNAGIVVNGPLMEIDETQFQQQLDVNLLGPFVVTKHFAPLMGLDPGFTGGPGRIVNIGSTSGTFSVPFMGPYNVSKYGLEALNDTFRRELRLFGIDVVLIGPRPVSTPMLDKNRNAIPTESKWYSRSLKRFSELSSAVDSTAVAPERLAHLIINILEMRNPKSRYSVVAPGLKSFLQFKLPLILPSRTVDRFFGRMLHLNPNES
jgi:NAD(P)-dependent dehydrogenase (short-subunit alcohol dehydrogenase family)